MRVARAFANMLRTAWHDPIWALIAVLRMPFLAFWPVVGGAVLVLLVGFVFQDRFRPKALLHG